ncbi:MAG TPA: universal stress protein [Kofleriaceae bacterium]|nr:universal stress protein [Kofleriaceae bacterium]
MAFHKILCPLSVTSLPKMAASSAVRLAGDAEVVLATNWYLPPVALATDGGGVPAAAIADMMADDERELVHVLRECKLAGARHVTSRLLVGAPSSEVLALLDSDEAIDLVVLGVDRMDRNGGMLVRGDIKRILFHSPCSVFLAPVAQSAERFRNILCYVDVTQEELPSLDVACELVEDGGSITVLHVHEVSLLEAASLRTWSIDDETDEEERLSAWSAKLEARCAVKANAIRRIGRPRSEITDVLKQAAFDLVILTGASARKVISGRLLREARCPVLFAHGRPDDRR